MCMVRDGRRVEVVEVLDRRLHGKRRVHQNGPSILLLAVFGFESSIKREEDPVNFGRHACRRRCLPEYCPQLHRSDGPCEPRLTGKM